MNTYNKNLATGKIELRFDYADYKALAPADQQKIKSNFLWSRSAGAWVSRSKHPNTWYAEEIAKGLNLQYEGEAGERLSFAEQIEQKQERALQRADRFENLSLKLESKSTALYNQSNKMASVIPMGQPILVGHYSEKRDRNFRDRIWNTMGKSVEAQKKAGYYADRAASSRASGDETKFKNPTYLNNRITELEAEERRAIKYSSDSYLLEVREKLDFFRGKLAECGSKIYTPAELKSLKATHVKYRGTWYPLKSINGKSVTFLNWLDIARITWKCDFPEIQDIKTVSDGLIVMDKGNNEVKPTIKHK